MVDHSLQPVVEAWQQELHRGLEYLRAGELDDAEACFVRAHRINPDSPEVCYALGREHLRRGRAVEAEPLLRAAWDGDRTLLSAAATLARCVGLSLGRHAEAHAVLDQAAACAGSAALLHVVRSELYLAQDQLDRAREAAETALQAPGNVAAAEAANAALARVCNREGILAIEAGAGDTALFLFKRAANLDPQWSSPHVNVGAAFARMGKRDQAWRAYERATRIDPDNPLAHLNVGLLLREAGDLDGARDALTRAVKLDPDSVGPLLALAEVYIDLDSGDMALALVSQALETNPDSADLWACLGAAFAAMDEREDAEACWRKALDLDPAHAAACAYLADLLTREARFLEAAILAERAQQHTRVRASSRMADSVPPAKRS